MNAIRPPAVAGQFYPGDPTALREMVEQMLASAPQSGATAISTLVAPHAGYAYSGWTAGHAFAQLAGFAPSRVVIMGPSHHYHFDRASIITSGAFATPLGEVEIDTPLAKELASLASTAPETVQDPEHAIEVELPFLQVVAPGAKIVPVIFGSTPSPWHTMFGRHLAEMLEPDDLVIVSTDWSHYLNNDAAHIQDRESIDAMLTQDCDYFQRGAAAGAYQLCGASAAVAGMACAKQQGKTGWTLLDYRTSGDVTGETARVVGYAALSFAAAEGAQ